MMILINKNELLSLVHSIRNENTGESYNINIESALCEIEEMVSSAQKEK